jgi:hypothetical protein
MRSTWAYSAGGGRGGAGRGRWSGWGRGAVRKDSQALAVCTLLRPQRPIIETGSSLSPHIRKRHPRPCPPTAGWLTLPILLEHQLALVVVVVLSPAPVLSSLACTRRRRQASGWAGSRRRVGRRPAGQQALEGQRLPRCRPVTGCLLPTSSAVTRQGLPTQQPERTTAERQGCRRRRWVGPGRLEGAAGAAGLRSAPHGSALGHWGPAQARQPSGRA